MQVFQRIAKPFREVALRKESVDRNNYKEVLAWVLQVALRKESVDRNLSYNYIIRHC